MTKKEVLEHISKYYAYHRTNINTIKLFRVINNVEVTGWDKNWKYVKCKNFEGQCHYKKGYGVYFNFNTNTYLFKGKYVYSCILKIKNPYITTDQIYSALITRDKKRELYKKGFDSVVLVRDNEIAEVVCFTNAQIVISEVSFF